MAEGTGTEGGTTTTGSEGAGASGSGSAGGASQAGGTGGGAPKTFTQEELERHIADRLNRQKAQFSDYDDLKAKAAEYERIQEANKSENEKALEKARKEAADTAKAETNKTWESRVLRSEVRLAAGGKLADPEDAIRFIDLSAFKVDDNGNVDEKAIAAAINELLKTKPYLAAGNGTRPATTRDFDAGSRTPSAGERSMNDLIRGAAGH